MDNRLLTPESLKEDSFDNTIRPQTLQEYIGQSENKENLSIFINRKQPQKPHYDWSYDNFLVIGMTGDIWA